MKRLVLTAALSLGTLAPLAAVAPAQAQMATSSEQMQTPDGSVRTTTRTESAGGTAATHTIDRPDGTRTVIRRQTDAYGETRTVRHDRGSNERTVCRSHWEHGQRVKHCMKRYR